MKILWLCTYPPINIPKDISFNSKKFVHPSSWIVNLSKRISDIKEIELYIVTFNREIKNNLHFIDNSIDFRFVKLPNFYIRSLLLFKWDQILLHKIINEINPDIIHSHGTEEIYSYIAIKSGYKNIISTQGIMNNCFDKLDSKFSRIGYIWFVMKILEIITIKKGKYFIAKSKYDESIINDICNHPRVFIIKEIISDIYFNVKRERDLSNNIMYFGIINKLKGFEEILKAFEIIYLKYPHVNLKIIGFGDNKYIQTINNKWKEIFHERLEMCGFKNKNEIAKELKNVLFVIHPSHVDNNPNTIWESMAAGVPVIASNVGGIPYIIKDGQNGILCPPSDHKELANKIEYLLNNREDIYRLGENAREFAKNQLNPEIITNNIYEAYKSVLKES